ncbi:hypothetical protein EDD85DRAFT_938163 [Armillaria nabsnona]|nr:hypothetical protein EDD85DRAFT_938163 [Armillaria nabsnona]
MTEVHNNDQDVSSTSTITTLEVQAITTSVPQTVGVSGSIIRIESDTILSYQASQSQISSPLSASSVLASANTDASFQGKGKDVAIAGGVAHLRHHLRHLSLQEAKATLPIRVACLLVTEIFKKECRSKRRALLRLRTVNIAVLLLHFHTPIKPCPPIILGNRWHVLHFPADSDRSIEGRSILWPPGGALPHFTGPFPDCEESQMDIRLFVVTRLSLDHGKEATMCQLNKYPMEVAKLCWINRTILLFDTWSYSIARKYPNQTPTESSAVLRPKNWCTVQGILALEAVGILGAAVEGNVVMGSSEVYSRV